MLAQAAFIWGMERSHIEAMDAALPELAGRADLLAEDGSEIPDPYFGDKAGVRATVDYIDELVVRRIPHIADALNQLNH